MMKKYHDVENVRFEQECLVLVVDGKEIKANIATLSPVLAGATEKERNIFEISPSGYGIHWPLIDKDISIDGMLGVVNRPGWEKQSA